MKMVYYSETDSLYVELASRPSTESREVAPDVILDFDASGMLVGIDIDRASTTVDLSILETFGLPSVLEGLKP